MKLLHLLSCLIILATAAFAAEKPSQLQKRTEPDRFPAEFESANAAARWVRDTFVSGKVEIVEPAAGARLIVFEHGSGIPVLGIGLYRKVSSKWQRMGVFRPPSQSGEFLGASVENGAIVLIGERTGRVWPFPEAK